MTANDLYNILLEDKPSISLKEHEEEVFQLIPELMECKGFDQHSNWHQFDVYEHILHVVDNVPNNLYLRVAALFHDVGKPRSFYLDENGVGHFRGHWDTSNEIFRKFIETHDSDNEFAPYISHLIVFHDLSGDKIPESVLYLLGEDGIKLLYELKCADLLAQSEEYHYLIDEYNQEEEKVINKCENIALQRRRSIYGNSCESR